MEDDGVFPARQEDSFLFLAARLGQADHGEIRVSDLDLSALQASTADGVPA